MNTFLLYHKSFKKASLFSKKLFRVIRVFSITSFRFLSRAFHGKTAGFSDKFFAFFG